MLNDGKSYSEFAARMLACEAEEIAFVAGIEAIKARKAVKVATQEAATVRPSK